MDSGLYATCEAGPFPLSLLMDGDGRIRYRGEDPWALLAEVERSLETDIDESTWAKIGKNYSEQLFKREMGTARRRFLLL